MRDINEKVREAALALNEVLKDMVIEFASSPKLNLSYIIKEFGKMLPSLNRTSHRELVLQWINLFDGLPIFNLTDHFAEIYDGLIGLLSGDFEPVMETFYEKIYIFFLNFKNTEKDEKHFNDLIKILEITIIKFKEWKSTMSKLYLLTLLHDIIGTIKQYLLYFDSHRVVIDQSNFNNQEYLDMIEEVDDESRRASNLTGFRESQMIDPYETGSVAYSRLNSFYNSNTIQKVGEDPKAEIIWTNLPENLVKIFEIIVTLSVEDEPIVRKIHKILFEIFKSVIRELNLVSIIKMNKLLVTQC